MESRDRSFRKPAYLGTEFNDFLFASIGVDASGNALTVVSALARLDLDPWTEAANLARLPGSIATQKLAAMVSRFPEIPLVRVDSVKIAARLTALLPGRMRGAIPASARAGLVLHPAARALMGPRVLLSVMFFTLGIMLITQVVVTQLHPADQISSAAQTIPHHGAPIKSPVVVGSNVPKPAE